MLSKTAKVTVIPGVDANPGQAASHTCYGLPPAGPTTDSAPPSDGSTGSDSVTPPAGTPILLEYKDVFGGYTSEESVAPAPAGFVCRYETVFVTVPGSTEPAAVYNVVCTEQ